MRNALGIVALILGGWVIPVLALDAEECESNSLQIGASWEFNEDGNPEGWGAYGSLSDVEISGGILVATVTGPGPCISGPEFSLAASDFGYLHLRMRVIGATAGMLIWETDTNPFGFVNFPVIGDSLFHEYEIPVHSKEKWDGQVRRITRICVDAKEGTQIEIDYIRVVSLGPRLEVKYFKPLRTVLRQSRPFPLAAVIRNTGDKSGSFTASLLLPEAVVLMAGDPTVEVSDLAMGEEDTLRWTVRANVSGPFSSTFRLYAENTEPVEVILETNIVDTAWKLDTFFLSAWSPPSLTDEAYDYYAKANFEMILSTPPDEAAVERAERYHMRCLLRIGSVLGENVFLRAPDNRPPEDLTPEDLSKLDSIVEKFRDNPTVYGYYVTDEPNAHAFPNLGKVVAYLQGKDPGRLAYINLFPTYASTEQLGTFTYDEHVEQFMDIVKPELLSYDHYHFFKGYDGSDYFYNLDIIRKWALSYDVPFCNIIQAIGYDVLNWRIPTEGEHRWLVYSSLAYGAKAIVYFHWDHSWGLTASPKRDELYASVQKLNREVNHLGPILIKLRSTGVYHSLNVPRGGMKLPEDALVEWVSEHADLVVGLFKDDADRDYLFLMNKDYTQGVTVTVVLDTSIRPLSAFNADTGTWEQVNLMDAKRGTVFQHTFLPGGGTLFAIGEPTKVKTSDGSMSPSTYALAQNYPNPFNTTTVISYELVKECSVQLTIYDVLGREVSLLVNRVQQAGRYKVTWPADRLSSGTYIYSLKAGPSIESRKMLLLK